MAEEKKGRKPDFSGEGIAIWRIVDKNGNAYLTVQILGRDGIRVNCFPTKKQGVRQKQGEGSDREKKPK